MNECLIAWHNEVVTDEDTVYHLGDLCYGIQQLRILEQLNGYHMVLPGKHDNWLVRA